MKRATIQIKVIAVLIFQIFAMSGFSQNSVDFKDEMIKSGERFEIPEEFKTSPDDYDSFLKSKLLNTSSNGSTIFIGPRELGISSIGGRVRAALVDKTNQIYLVAPSGGGLWKFNALTNDEFEPVNDFGSFMAITDIAQSPFNYNHILIGTGDGLHGIPGNGLFESKDGGNTFAKMISIDPKSNPDFNYIRFVKFSPYDSKTIYFSTNYKIFKSVNSGLTWDEVFNSGYSNIHSLDFLVGESIIIGVDNKGIFTSSNGNQNSFNLVTNDLPNDGSGANNGPIDGVVAATHAANRNIAYAFFTGTANDVYKTTDNGVTWTLLTKPDFYIQQTWFCLTIGVHPVDPDIVILGSVLWAYTTDGGTSWKEGAGLEVDFHSVHFHGSDPNVAYLGYDQGLGRVDFNKYADTWVWNGSNYVIEKQPEQLEIGKNEGFNTSQIYYGDYFPQQYGDSYLQGQQDGGCFGKVNNNAARIVVGDGGSVFVNKQNPLKAFASTQMGNLSTTSSAIPPAYNYSRIGSFYNNHPNWITQFAGNNSDGSQIYISDKTSIQRTLDGGTNFSTIATHSLNYVKIAVQDKVDPLVYVVGYNPTNGRLDLISIQNAATNPLVSIRNDILSSHYGSPDHIEIDPNDENSVFSTSSSGKAFKISNINSSAFTVKSIMGDAGNIVFNTVIGVKNKPEIFIAGTNIGLFYSTNSGVNWFLSNELPYTQITDLKLRESDNRLFVFTHGRGTWAVTVNTDTDLVHEISCSTNPSNAGTVSGTGLIKNYFTATLVATPAPGFRFVNWTIDDIVVSTSENYSFTVTQSQSLVANFESVQIIPFKVGWNIFSSNLKPTDSDIKSIFDLLISNQSLIKIQDEGGHSLEDWGVFGGWQNHIGNISPTEGYKIKLIKADNLEVCGAPVKYPFAIPLQEGWNIIGYPNSAAYDGLEVVQQLIDRGKLIKVQDEEGNSIEDWGIFGSWQNNIYDFASGKGYNVKLSTTDTLWINESYSKSSGIKSENIATIHFKTELEGNGLDHMNINLVGLPVNVLQAGDELAIFDGTTCVGAVALTSRNINNQSVSIAASAKDNQGMAGFAEENPIMLKLWNSKQNTEFILEPEIVKGTSTFAKHETMFASLEKYATTGLEGITSNGLTEINCYPNPFSDAINIEIKLAKDSEVQVEVLNQLGQRIKFLQTSKMLNSGIHRLMWDGRNAENQQVSTGIYHLRLTVNDNELIRKMVYSK